MDNKPKRVIEAVFKNIYGRECKYYQRSGILWWSDWEEVPYGSEGGFFEGSVVTEAQLNFTHEKYGSGDIYLLLDFAAGIGIVLISAVVVVDVTLAVMAKLEALAFYVENFGVRQGFEMYKYLGVENLPNGVISWLQADMADGDSSVDDLVEGGSNFKNQDLLDSHYDKHGSEFGNITKDEYLQGANDLINSTSDDILTKTRANGDIIYYNPLTNEFAVKSADGYIRTYFKPVERLDYFNKQ